MIDIALKICQVILYISIVMVFIRIWRGPRVLDRVLCLDALSVCVIGILVLESIRSESAHFIDLILIFSLLNFIGTVAFVFYLNKTYDEQDYQREKRKAKLKKGKA